MTARRPRRPEGCLGCIKRSTSSFPASPHSCTGWRSVQLSVCPAAVSSFVHTFRVSRRLSYSPHGFTWACMSGPCPECGSWWTGIEPWLSTPPHHLLQGLIQLFKAGGGPWETSSDVWFRLLELVQGLLSRLVTHSC